MPKNSGFTLIELMVVIAIIAVLSVVGITIFTNVQNNAADTRKKADLNAMLKAYDLRYSTLGTYQDPDPAIGYKLKDSDFSTGKVPNLDGFSIIRSTTTNGIRVCVQLGSSSETCKLTTDDNCFCKGTALEQSPTDADIAAGGTSIAYITTPPAAPPPADPPPPPPPPPPAATNTNQPNGNFEIANCTELRGWTCDNDSSTTAITANFYDGSGLTSPVGNITASINRPDLVSANVCGGTGNHGFSFTTPSSLKDGLAHNIYAYGTNINSAGAADGTSPQLPSSPKTLTCNPGSGSNLLNNPGFESSLSNWLCQKDEGKSTGTCTSENTAANVRVGSKSAKITQNGTGWGVGVFHTGIPDNSQKQYCLSGWIKKSTANASASLHFKDPTPPAGAGYLGISVPGVQNHTNWQYSRGTITITSTWTAPFEIVLATSTPGATVWYDNIWLSHGACN